MTVMDVFVELTTTSSLDAGNAPVLQFVVVFQSPLPPTHVSVAACAQRTVDRRQKAKRKAESGNEPQPS